VPTPVCGVEEADDLPVGDAGDGDAGGAIGRLGELERDPRTVGGERRRGAVAGSETGHGGAVEVEDPEVRRTPLLDFEGEPRAIGGRRQRADGARRRPPARRGAQPVTDS
jgi:hypothetical protein